MTCWGCGLRLLLPSYAPVFKCGWCGAITNQNKQKCDKQHFRWRLLRDRCIVSIVLVFMLFLICKPLLFLVPAAFWVLFVVLLFDQTRHFYLGLTSIFSPSFLFFLFLTIDVIKSRVSESQFWLIHSTWNLIFFIRFTNVTGLIMSD